LDWFRSADHPDRDLDGAVALGPASSAGTCPTLVNGTLGATVQPRPAPQMGAPGPGALPDGLLDQLSDVGVALGVGVDVAERAVVRQLANLRDSLGDLAVWLQVGEFRERCGPILAIGDIHELATRDAGVRGLQIGVDEVVEGV